MAQISLARKVWQTLSSIKTGVVLLIVTVMVSAAGTVILQRPATDADQMSRAYSPAMLRFLDATGLTDVFHAWWFLLLLGLVSLSIIAASIQRFPNSWRYFSRPYKSPDESFRQALPLHTEFAIPDEAAGVSAADRVLRKAGFKPEHIVREHSFSLYGERHRISEMAVYIVHASLLLIFMGGIIDGLYGWRGFVTLTQDQQSSQVQEQNGKIHHLGFSVRCDGAGQENYTDGTPKRWWSNLAVISEDQVVLRKQIVVNEPLVYRGVRFYQASYGQTGKLDKLLLTATSRGGKAQTKDIALSLGKATPLDADTTVRLAEFIPDYAVRDGEVYARSNELGDPAAHLVLESKVTGKAVNVWLPPIDGVGQNAESPYSFEGRDLKMAYFTGLEVSHEPGQWWVWAGVVVMGIGLFLVFYVIHMRIWAVPVRDRNGRLVLWLGGSANRNKDAFEQRFRKLAEQMEKGIKLGPESCAVTHESSIAGR